MFPIYLLNCEGAGDRRDSAVKRITDTFDRAPILITSPNKNDPDWLKKTMPSTTDWMSPGQVCCASGHILMLLAFLKTKASFALCCEDDVTFNKPSCAFERAIGLVKKACPRWHWVNFEHMFAGQPAEPKLHLESPIGEDFKNMQDEVFHAYLTSYGTACYAISRKGAMFVINNNVPVIMCSDHVMRSGSVKPSVFGFNTFTAYAGQSGSPSIINE